MESTKPRSSSCDAAAAKHTPGPWRFGKRSDDVVADTNAGHSDDADSLDWYGGHLVAESIAPQNRALIAAAPEMLSLLETCLGNVMSLGPAGALSSIPTPYRVWADCLVNVIAKAKGIQADEVQP